METFTGLCDEFQWKAHDDEEAPFVVQKSERGQAISSSSSKENDAEKREGNRYNDRIVQTARDRVRVRGRDEVSRPCQHQV
eukprot:3793681-Rhodomonas_salina.1